MAAIVKEKGRYYQSGQKIIFNPARPLIDTIRYGSKIEFRYNNIWNNGNLKVSIDTVQTPVIKYVENEYTPFVLIIKKGSLYFTNEDGSIRNKREFCYSAKKRFILFGRKEKKRKNPYVLRTQNLSIEL